MFIFCNRSFMFFIFFFFNDTATTEIYTLSLHDALPISTPLRRDRRNHVVAPELAEIFDGIGERVGAHHGRRVLGAVEHKNVGYSDFSRITAAELRLVLSSEIVGEGFFGVGPEFLSPCATWRRCACLALDA